jgi:hypothetical protein
MNSAQVAISDILNVCLFRLEVVSSCSSLNSLLQVEEVFWLSGVYEPIMENVLKN